MSPPPQVPYIGSTISLLSKASIRYEGFLYTIDQKESSVALSHVKVFGTEDRQCDRPVPPSDEIFEFIIFRASDITELKVIDTPPVRSVPDPAIIRAQNKAPSADHHGSGAAAAEPNTSVKNFLSQAGPIGPQAAGSSGVAGASSGAAAASLGPSVTARQLITGEASSGRQGGGRQQHQQSRSQSSQQPQQQQQQQQQSQQPLMLGQPPQQRRYQGGKSFFSGSDQQQQQPARSYYSHQHQQQQRRSNNNGGSISKDFYDMTGYGGRSSRYGPQGPPPLQSMQPMQTPHYRSGSGYPPYHHPGYGYSMMPPPMMQQPPPLSLHHQQRRYGRPVMHFRRYPGAPGSGGGGRYVGNRLGQSQQQQQHWGGRQQQLLRHNNSHHHHHQQQHQPLVDPIPARFTADYDFETANAEMEAELAKLVLGGDAADAKARRGSAAASAAAAATAAAMAATADAVSDTAAASDGAPPKKAHAGYDKERSFFDDISRVELDEAAAAAAASAESARAASASSGAVVGGLGVRKETMQRQNALNKETFGLIGGRMRRGIGNRFYGNRGYQRRALV